MASANTKHVITFDRDSRRVLERIAKALEVANDQNKVVVSAFAYGNDDIVEEVEDDPAEGS